MAATRRRERLTDLLSQSEPNGRGAWNRQNRGVDSWGRVTVSLNVSRRDC
jgi:hypothetical protein